MSVSITFYHEQTVGALKNDFIAASINTPMTAVGLDSHVFVLEGVRSRIGGWEKLNFL